MTPPTPKLPPLPDLRVRPATALNLLLAVLALVAFVLLATRSGPDLGVEVERRAPAPGIDEIRVDVRGAVGAAGVYPAAPGDRIADVLERAGGPTADADLVAVNLSLRVRDQDLIHIPALNEAAPALLDLNSASQAELESLPGIGPVRATAIIQARPFTDTDELRTRGVIPANVYEQVRMLITIHDRP